MTGDPDRVDGAGAAGGDAGTVAVGTVLVPVDGTGASVDAAEHAAAVADRYGADVHALYVSAGAVGGEPRADADAQAFLDDVRAVCESASVDLSCSTAVGFSTGRLTRHPGSVVLDCADAVGADFLVIPRAPTTVETPAVLEKAAEYVLSYASQPVLSV